MKSLFLVLIKIKFTTLNSCRHFQFNCGQCGWVCEPILYLNFLLSLQLVEAITNLCCFSFRLDRTSGFTYHPYFYRHKNHSLPYLKIRVRHFTRCFIAILFHDYHYHFIYFCCCWKKYQGLSYRIHSMTCIRLSFQNHRMIILKTQ